MKTYLLFVRNPYAAAILEGRKTFEVRAGAKYANVKAGEHLSINGRLRVEVTRVDRYDDAESLVNALRDSAFPLTRNDVSDCYPGVASGFYVFHFTPPTATASPRRLA